MTADLPLRPTPAACRISTASPGYQVWQEWKKNQARGIHRGSHFPILTPLTGAEPASRACAPTTTPLELFSKITMDISGILIF